MREERAHLVGRRDDLLAQPLDVRAAPLVLDDAQRAAIVDEANVVFRLNIAIFDELEGNPLKSFLSVALNSLKEKLFG